MITLTMTSVYREPDAAKILYALLEERPKEANISHSAMPTFEQHCRFMRSIPYRAWFLVRADDIAVGSVYLTRADEIGIFIFKEHQGKGYASAVLTELRKRHTGRMLANINPANKRSVEFFKKHGAKLIQHTYEL